MRRKKSSQIIIGILAIMAITLVLGGRARAQQCLDGAPDRPTHSMTSATSLGTLAPHYKVIYAFSELSNGGSEPHEHLIFDAAGNLYGVDQYGGTYGNGIVYELSPQPNGTWAEEILYSFTGGADGSWPTAALVFDPAGNLYGATWLGGQYGAGVVFELSPNPDGTWTQSVLHTFTGGTDGSESWGALVMDAAGNLYGTTVYGGADGGGIAFQLVPNSDGTWTENILHTFTGGADGWCVPRGLVFDPAGNLYGTTAFGGAHNDGTVFELSPAPDGSWTEAVLHSFNSADGAQPHSTPVFDSLGRLYGTTWYGGAYGNGVVFILIPNPDGTWTEKVLHGFAGGSDGANPFVGVTFDASGNLYGTALAGGANNDGVVFMLTPTGRAGASERVIHAFTGFGSSPQADVIFDASGNLYGTTWGGSGMGANGIVYEISP